MERSEYTLELGVPLDLVDDPLSVAERDERLSRALLLLLRRPVTIKGSDRSSSTSEANQQVIESAQIDCCEESNFPSFEYLVLNLLGRMELILGGSKRGQTPSLP